MRSIPLGESLSFNECLGGYARFSGLPSLNRSEGDTEPLSHLCLRETKPLSYRSNQTSYLRSSPHETLIRHLCRHVKGLDMYDRTVISYTTDMAHGVGA